MEFCAPLEHSLPPLPAALGAPQDPPALPALRNSVCNGNKRPYLRTGRFSKMAMSQREFVTELQKTFHATVNNFIVPLSLIQNSLPNKSPTERSVIAYQCAAILQVSSSFCS